MRTGDLFAPVPEPPAGASLSHRPPKIPFTVAGVTHGQPLHFVWRHEQNQLIGFVGNEWRRKPSSVQSNGATLLLFEHIHFAGDTLLVLPMELLNNLADVGWNDRVSSIKNFGKIY
jgi:hypothetical protein